MVEIQDGQEKEKMRGRGFRAFRVAATERPDGANASRAWRQSGRRLDLGGDPS